ncbi:MAG: hypothetical protein B7Y43_07350 [Sphingomonas sp. 28-62-20]|uniref:DUF6489 family protein n=1 Tax=Sphingomonas sp. 28-62-20 TaxID=1970433 RepID=UPI000A0E6574|nr:MAG: hypothetical protein BVN33_02645 [Proteobacteria bacterium ST_bin13]OYY78215.1 MAG: hypothetical protein B7Y43_07350 [Sphingomonas sp. 28-62-20]
MKINVEVECTPEEARRLMGLPDFSPVHEKYITALTDSMDGHIKPEMLESMMRSWAPMGEAGMNFWRQLFDGSTKPKG